MGLTIKQIVEKMISAGYKLTEGTVKYYLSLNLLPEPEKHGIYGEGVKLVFPNEVLNTLTTIFKLKGRGYKLGEISEELRKQEVANRLLSRERWLTEAYFEKDGEIYQELSPDIKENIIILERTHEDIEPSSLYGGIQPSVWKRPFYRGFTFEPMKKIEIIVQLIAEKRLRIKKSLLLDGLKGTLEHKLFITTDAYEGIPIYNIFDLCFYPIPAWIELRHNYGINWKTLKELSKKHKSNIEKSYYWPKPDGVRHSTKSIAHWKRKVLNKLGAMIVKYLERIREGFIDSELGICPDYAYDHVDDFINGFLNDECAFVPEVTDSFFLAKMRGN